MSIWDKFREISGATGKPEFLIVGLGNVGIQYENTRHNAGFIEIDRLAEKYNSKINRLKFKSNCEEVTVSDKKCLLMKPNTYMNNSGEAVVEAMNFYKIPIENVIVIYDDISLDVGKMRIRRKGTHGGHNGIRSIIDLTGSEDFPRIKIGVGKKPHPDYNLADWVLSRFKPDELKQLQELGDAVCESVELIVKGDIEKAMNRHNS